MKKTNRFILMVLLSTLHSPALFAQGSGENQMLTGCGTDPSVVNNNQPVTIQSADCSKLSQAWNNTYKLQTTYIPSTSQTANKTIPINIVIFGENNGTGFPITQNDVNTDLANYQYWLNFAYVNTQNTTYPPMNPAYLPNSKINFVINNVYFYNNSTILNDASSGQVSAAINYHLQQNPSAINQVNCYILKTFHISGAAGWANTYTYSGQSIPYIMTGSNYTNYQTQYQGTYFYFESHLPHELGHLLGLWHTYNSETLNPSNPEFLDDVFASTPVYFNGDNVMGGTPTNEFISPKQMGRMHRSASTDNVYSNIRHWVIGYSATPHLITSNETWDFTYKSYNDIVVQKGATLTVKCRLEMVKEAKIVVEQGGQLIVDGGTITSARSAGPANEGLWKGIEVWGNDTKSQLALDPQGYYYQGRVELKNGAIVENAIVAIQANNPNVWGQGGGIIRISGSTIKNCWKGVHFTSYPNYISISYINNSTFETTADLMNGYLPQTFIEGWSFRGLKVTSCTFRNTNPNATTINKLGKGIYLESAKAYIKGNTTAQVTDFCNDANTAWLPNRFENLYKGVELVNVGMQQTNSIFTSVITRNVFSNCIYGIECKGMPAVTINQNKFILGNNPVSYIVNEGILHRSYTGFSIQENCIEQTGTNAPLIGGIIVSEVGGDNNEVYRNKSFGTKYAYLSNGKNRTAAPTNQMFKGLQFLCNENNGSQSYDIAVTGDGQNPNDPMNGIRYYQGGSGNSQSPLASGNTFTNSCITIASDLYNNTINPYVYFHSTNTQEIPTCYSGNVAPSTSAVVSNSCPTKLCDIIYNPCTLNDLIQAFNTINSGYQAAEAEYMAMLDNGNTSYLLQQIASATSETATDLKNLLLENSPNLSAKVILALIDKAIHSNDDLFTIISQNPDVTRNEELLKILAEKDDPMNSSMITQLRTLSANVTDRTMLEMDFAAKQYERESAAWDIVRFLLSEETGYEQTELHNWLNIIGSPRAKYMIAEDLAARRQFTEAWQLLNTISTADLDRYETNELNGMKTIHSLFATIAGDHRNIYQLTATERSSLLPFAQNERMYGLAGTIAANILNLYAPNSYVISTIYPEEGGSPKIGQPTEPGTEKSAARIQLFPNPANNEVVVIPGDSFKSGILLIYGSKGELAAAQPVNEAGSINVITSELKNGLYLIKVIDSQGNIIGSEKFIVEHNN